MSDLEIANELLASTRADLARKHAAYRDLYALWCRVARAVTPSGGPDITDEEVAVLSEARQAELEAARKDIAGLRSIIRVNNEVSDLAAVRKLVGAQAHDEGLWFNSVYAAEQYVQDALRELHEAIENPAKATELAAHRREIAP